MKKKKQMFMYSNEDLENALKAVKKGESLRKVSEKFGIPKSTLHIKSVGLVSKRCRRGPSTILTTEEEVRLKKWIIGRAKVGIPTHASEAKDAAQYVLEEAKRKTVFKNNRPGDNWFNRFLIRHPEVKNKIAEVISKCKATAIESSIRQWHRECKIYLEEIKFENVLNRPKSIFTANDISIKLATKEGKLSEVKNKKNLYKIARRNEKASYSVLCTFSAAGNILPPMIAYPYKKIPSHLAKSVSSHQAIPKPDSDWMIAIAFYKYITNVFYPWCLQNNIEFPVIFFVDGHKLHFNLQLSDFCNEHKIILYPLFPHATNIIQPCDVAIFKELKKKWRTVLCEYKSTAQQSLRKVDFALVFKKALNQINITSIKNAFKECGLYPWDENSIKYNKCISFKENESIENENIECTNLTAEDVISTKKFFQRHIPKSTLQYYNTLIVQNKSIDDTAFKLWEICNDFLNKNSDISNKLNNENSVMETTLISSGNSNNEELHVDNEENCTETILSCDKIPNSNDVCKEICFIDIDDLPVIDTNNLNVDDIDSIDITNTMELDENNLSTTHSEIFVNENENCSSSINIKTDVNLKNSYNLKK